MKGRVSGEKRRVFVEEPCVFPRERRVLVEEPCVFPRERLVFLGDESPRLSWRLPMLRGWSHGTSEQVLRGGSRASGAVGLRAAAFT
ncbi:MAG: hypothetical protein ACLQBL_32650, partial [Polyangiaceae bacterium]